MQTSFEGEVDPEQYGFDAAIEYPPHNTFMTDMRERVKFFDPDIQSNIFSYSDMVNKSLLNKKPEYTRFRGVLPDWDCTPRRKNPDVFIGSSPSLYSKWLEGQCQYTQKNLIPEEKFVFINAWNEWAEALTWNLTENMDMPIYCHCSLLKRSKHLKVAVVAHIYYDDLINEFLSYFQNIPMSFDLYVSTRPEL